MSVKAKTAATVGAALWLLLAGLGLAALTAVPITHDPGNQGRPDIYGGTVVWKGNQAGNWDIYAHDLNQQSSRAISLEPHYQNLPVTNGEAIIWQDDRSGDWDLYLYRPASGEEPLLVAPGNQGLPAVSGNTVVFVDDRSGNNDIYQLDLATREVKPVCAASGDQWQPQVSGGQAVWQDFRSGKWEVYAADLVSGVEQRVAGGPGDNKVADISGDRVVWQRCEEGRCDIWLRSLSGGAEERLTDDAALQNSPRLSGDLVVWEDYRNGNYDLYMKDLTSGVESALADGPATQARPAIDRETVVWEATGDSGYDIWLARVPDTVAPTINPQAPAESGCVTPMITAGFSDNRSGIQAESVRLSLDGVDVSGGAAVSAAGVTYRPAGPLAAGSHSVSLSVSDQAGNSASAEWQFTVNRPALTLGLIKSYWASYDDYSRRLLSLKFRLSATGPAAAFANRVIAAPASAGVALATPLPLALGDLPVGGQQEFELKFTVPGGVNSFKVTIYASTQDSCGNSFFFPGPPPAS